MSLPNGFKLAPGEVIVQCPYEKAHQVTNSRLMFHLTKCRNYYIRARKEQGLSVEYAECKYNFLHKVFKPELEQHHATCPNQSKIVKFAQKRRTFQSRQSVIKQSQSPEKKPLINDPTEVGDFKEAADIKDVKVGEETSATANYASKEDPDPCKQEAPVASFTTEAEEDVRCKSEQGNVENVLDEKKALKCNEAHLKEEKLMQGNPVEDQKLPRKEPEDFDRNDGCEDEEYYEEEWEQTENWDEDWDRKEEETKVRKGYDPSLKLKNTAVMYHPMGLTKSERKAFHLSNVAKFRSAYAAADTSHRKVTSPRSPLAGQTPAKRAKREP